MMTLQSTNGRKIQDNSTP